MKKINILFLFCLHFSFSNAQDLSTLNQNASEINNPFSYNKLDSQEFIVSPNPILNNKIIFTNTNGNIIDKVNIFTISRVQIPKEDYLLDKINNSIDVPTLTPGVYIAHIYSGSTNFIRRIVVR